MFCHCLYSKIGEHTVVVADVFLINERRVRCQTDFYRQKAIISADSGIAQRVSADRLLKESIHGINRVGDVILDGRLGNVPINI